ncbi:glycosyltransferase family 4 protein [Patescibacteria group bacterium]|nr:glycosyltransferase family 4 protein [Patescibacteria group bacterium]
MKILQVNKFFYLRGGSSRYFFEVSKLLKSHSHEVAYFSMTDEKNGKSKWSKYFVNNASFEKVSLSHFTYVASRMFYSFEARQKITELLDDFKTDIAHLHSIYHHISPSTIFELKKRNIPIVQTVHDYHLIAPSHTLFHDGRICELTKKHNFFKAVFHKCVKKSYIASFAEALEQYIYLILNINKYIDTFIAPSRFMIKKLIEYGIDENKIQILNSFCEYKEYKPDYDSDNYILYFGRLSPEKGLNFLIGAMKYIPYIKLKNVGDGSIKKELMRKVLKLNIKSIEFMGYKSGVELKKMIYRCRFIILPSVCYEIFPLSVLEAFSSGKPVIASNIGGIPEIVKDGYNGYLVEPGNAEDLADKISKLWDNPSLCRKMGKNAREYVEKNYGPREHYEKLMDIYRKAIDRHR